MWTWTYISITARHTETGSDEAPEGLGVACSTTSTWAWQLPAYVLASGLPTAPTAPHHEGLSDGRDDFTDQGAESDQPTATSDCYLQDQEAPQHCDILIIQTCTIL